MLSKPGQPGGQATRRAVAKANRLSDEKAIPHEADLRGNWSCQGSRLYPMARASAEELRRTHRAPGVLKAAILDSTAGKVRKVKRTDRNDPLNVKDRAYNRQNREMARSSPDWRMRSPSVDGRDNITRSERGPLGSGGDFAADALL